MTKVLGSTQAFLAAVGLTVAVSAIYLVPNAMMWDDLTWYWLFHVQGPGAIFEYMNQSAHPGYGPVLNAALWAGGHDAGRIATAIGLTFHLIAGVIFWRILVEARTGDRFPVIGASLFLLAPYVALRGSVAHVQYDIFIALYLFSIWLSGRNGWMAQGGAFLCVIGGLSIEPLAALEILRWWYLRGKGAEGRNLAFRMAPCALAVALVLVSRLTWLQPYGAYAGYNKLHLDVLSWPTRLWSHIRYYLDCFKLTFRLAHQFWRFDNIVVVMLVALPAGFIAFAQTQISSKIRRIEICVVGGLIFLAGALPYVVIDQAPFWQGFSSRFAVASQFGAILLLAAIIDSITIRAVFFIVVGLITFGFAAVQVQFGKWMTYDALMMHGIRASLAKFYSHTPPQVAMVRFVPASRHFLYRERCLSLNDMNVLVALHGQRHGSFGYDTDCVSPGDPVMTKNQCSVSGRDSEECPGTRTNLEFSVAPGADRYYIFSTIDLLAHWRNGDLDAGVLRESRSDASR